MNDRIQITHLKIRDFKGIAEANLDLEGNLVVAGDTAQGKSSVLEALEAAFVGADKEMIRHGADFSQIYLEMTGDRSLERTMRQGDKDVLVIKEKGEPLSDQRAKALCKVLYNPISFHLQRWVEKSGADEGNREGMTKRRREQRDELLSVVPATLTVQDIQEELQGLGGDVASVADQLNLPDDLASRHGLMACTMLETQAYDARKEANRELAELGVQVKMHPCPEKVPQGTVDQLEVALKDCHESYVKAVAMLESRQATADRAHALRNELQADMELLRSMPEPQDTSEMDQRIEATKENIESIERQINELRAVLHDEETRLSSAHQARREENDRVEARKSTARKIAEGKKELQGVEESLGGTPQDPAPLEAEVKRLQGDVELRKQADAHKAALEDFEAKQLETRALDKLVGLFRNVLPKRILNRMDLPVEGLSLDGDTLKVNGVPLHQLGTSETLRVGVMVALAANKRLGVVCVDKWESTGTKERQAILGACKEAGARLLAALVDPKAEPGPGQVVMQEGKPR